MPCFPLEGGFNAFKACQCSHNCRKEHYFSTRARAHKKYHQSASRHSHTDALTSLSPGPYKLWSSGGLVQLGGATLASIAKKLISYSYPDFLKRKIAFISVSKGAFFLFDFLLIKWGNSILFLVSSPWAETRYAGLTGYWPHWGNN